jgi:hypothetical protein
MIKAQCHICHRLFEVPDNRALTYIMMNLIPCRECAQRFQHTSKHVKLESRQETK